MTVPADALVTAAEWRRSGCPVALATILATFGSAPFPVGSHLAVAADGRFAGAVSGGCVEAAVVDAARSLLTATPGGGSNGLRRMSFEIGDATAWSVGLTCGGRLEIMIQRLDDAVLAMILDARTHRRPLAVLTRLSDGVVPPFAEALAADRVAAETLLAAGTSGIVGGPGDDAFFVRIYLPPPRLVVVGAGPIAHVLAPMAILAGIEVTVIDPRRAYAGPGGDGRKGFDVVHESPATALALPPLRPDARTAVVTLTHHPAFDDPALVEAVRSPAFYIGALGSRRTHATRCDRLRRAGLSEAEIARIHGPVGLALGGRGAADIAVSILAALIQARAQR